MDEQLGRRDLLSDLPSDIIQIILGFVPNRDAARTSLLSRRWRYLWTSDLAFDKECVDPPMETESDIMRLRDFISQTLLLQERPIHKLQLRLPDISLPFLSVNLWLIYLSLNNIRILDLEFLDDSQRLMRLTSLYLCKKLTHLTLRMCTFPPLPPSFKGFLFLRSLHVSMQEVDSSYAIESIVAHSPLLEELTLADNIFSRMAIRAPNLKFFHFDVGSARLSLCTPLLEELLVYFERLKHLSFHGSSVFHHLRIITLSDVPFNRKKTAMAVDHLLKRSPNLQKLKISNARKDDAPERAFVSFCDTESAPGFTYDSLKVIEMKFFSCGINEMKLIKFLLARSPVLERMIYCPRGMHGLSEQVLLNLTAELLSYPRASASAEIVIDIKQKSSDLANCSIK